MRRDQTRREFMGLATAGLLTRPLRLLAPIDPDLVVYNARVYTMDGSLPRAEAFAVAGSRFVAVGGSAEMRALAGPGTRAVDAKGMSVVPGFTDAHNHAGGTM